MNLNAVTVRAFHSSFCVTEVEIAWTVLMSHCPSAMALWRVDLKNDSVVSMENVFRLCIGAMEMQTVKTMQMKSIAQVLFKKLLNLSKWWCC